MKSLILFSLLSLPIFRHNELKTFESKVEIRQSETPPEICYTPLSAVVFKNQEYCRAEVPDFDFDAHFIILSATVYFSGANFDRVEKGTIKNASLRPLNNLMKRCIPGSIVTFDNVTVKGPDNEIRSIAG